MNHSLIEFVVFISSLKSHQVFFVLQICPAQFDADGSCEQLMVNYQNNKCQNKRHLNGTQSERSANPSVHFSNFHFCCRLFPAAEQRALSPSSGWWVHSLPEGAEWWTQTDGLIKCETKAPRNHHEKVIEHLTLQFIVLHEFNTIAFKRRLITFERN